MNMADCHLRGRIIANDKTGAVLKVREKDGEEIKVKSVVREMRIYTQEPNEIKEIIASATKKLYEKYSLVIQNDLFKSLRPDTITPTLAVSKYGMAAVDYNHGKACVESKGQYYTRLKRAASKLPRKPMAEIGVTQLNSWLKQNKISSTELQELKKFWEYCLTKGVCFGENPIHIPRKKKNKKNKKKNIVKIDRLLAEQSEDLYNHIEDNPTGPRMGTVLALGAGFYPAKSLELKWADMTFFEENFVVVRDYIAERAGATKNYSRPLMPRAARIINLRYNQLLKEYSPKQLENMPVVSAKEDPSKAYNAAALKKDAYRLIGRYISYEMMTQITNEDLDYAAPLKILHNTYKYDLQARCSLYDDPSVCGFLLRKSLLGDVTSDSYRAFTSPSGLRHMHELTLFLDKDLPILDEDVVVLNNESSTLKKINPATNHCTVEGYMEIEFLPGKEHIIQSRYGAIGHIEISHE